MRIAILIHNIYGVGGTNRTVINLAAELSERHDVEIVSILRRLDRPMMEIPAKVSVVGLVDLRRNSADSKDPRNREMSQMVPVEEEFYRFYSRLTDDRVADYLRRTPYDVVVGTRSALNLYVARLGRPGSVRIAQEHMTQDMIPGSVHEAMRLHYPRLSAVTTVTEADATAVRELLGPDAPPVSAIPNSVPEPSVTPTRGDRKIVVAAGRLHPIKRYDLLVRAFAKVITERPDWTLRIYGDGGESRRLGTLIADLGLQNHVFRMGGYSPLDAEWVKGSIAAVTSDKESFGMTIVEAMRCGLPVVSTACPVGPAEIIRDGEDGLLVPTGDVDAIATALLRLMNDDELRVRFGVAARENSRRYDPALIAGRYERLFQEHLAAGRPLRSVAARLRTPARTLRSSGRALIRVLPDFKVRKDVSPVASCHLENGQVIVTVPGDGLPRHLTHLVCRPRRIEGVRKAVKIPLAGDPAQWSAAFPARSEVFAEGRWDLYLSDRRSRLYRLRAGVLDVRDFIGGDETAPFTRNVPYPTKDKFVAVAAWSRAEHAELGEIRYGLETITVTGRLIAGDFGGTTPTLVLTAREREETLTVDGADEGAGHFSFDVPVARLAASRLRRYEDWDAAVSRGPDGTGITIARLMDDVVERKRTYVYPSVRVDDEQPPELFEETPVAEVRITPYLTIQSGLAFVVTDRPV
ncbi:glycosyl transferase family 1 [Actinoplanes ianthinogenes]|uniref:Glycosyl transferase family 1 n=1 Tax=Actinoplanes ianthinogenes TaxID=122358 RepID=A0ABM7LTW4_9ACTN|nr:glycosyltransferase family 4 protein [Actinoplanes ianthinogenes]BCJ42781.1 glycosyl transferase family 1 [Actinoplanes ianthinogenes]GGQ92244.1 glycosyl transferase family 1 [Actinoplanes ianthinogenes]